MQNTHINIRIVREVYDLLKAGEKRHWIFLSDQRAKTGDVVKFQVENSPDTLTFQLGHVEEAASNFSVATLKPHTERNFTQPFSLKGDGEKYKGAFFQRRSK